MTKASKTRPDTEMVMGLALFLAHKTFDEGGQLSIDRCESFQAWATSRLALRSDVIAESLSQNASSTEDLVSVMIWSLVNQDREDGDTHSSAFVKMLVEELSGDFEKGLTYAEARNEIVLAVAEVLKRVASLSQIIGTKVEGTDFDPIAAGELVWGVYCYYLQCMVFIQTLGMARNIQTIADPNIQDDVFHLAYSVGFHNNMTYDALKAFSALGRKTIQAFFRVSSRSVSHYDAEINRILQAGPLVVCEAIEGLTTAAAIRFGCWSRIRPETCDRVQASAALGVARGLDPETIIEALKTSVRNDDEVPDADDVEAFIEAEVDRIMAANKPLSSEDDDDDDDETSSGPLGAILTVNVNAPMHEYDEDEDEDEDDEYEEGGQQDEEGKK